VQLTVIVLTTLLSGTRLDKNALVQLLLPITVEQWCVFGSRFLSVCFCN